MEPNKKAWHSAYVAVGPLVITAACFLGLVLERSREFCFLAGAFWSLVAAGCLTRYYMTKRSWPLTRSRAPGGSDDRRP